MSLRLARLRRGELLAGGLAAVLIALLFAVHWFAPGGHSSGADGWATLPVLRWLILVTAACGLLLALLQATCPAPALPVTMSVFVTALALITLLALAIRLITTSDVLLAGAWLGLVCAAGMLLGGFWSMRDEDGWVPGPDHPIERVDAGPAHRPGAPTNS